MGAVDFSIDPELVAIFKRHLPLQVFVETGTFEGMAIGRVRSQFEEIHSIEASPEYYAEGVSRFKDDPKIFLHLGQSPEILQQIATSLLNKSVLYWLDAHWCVADDTAGQSSQCPLLEELGAISRLNEQSVILIDDARLFLCPPPRPHEISQWPSFDSVLKRLRGLSPTHEIMILNDVIICFPTVARESLTFYAHEHSTDWLTAMDKARDYDLLLAQLKEKEAVIQEKEAAIQEKEAVIRELAEACEARLNEMNKLADELQRLKLPSIE